MRYSRHQLLALILGAGMATALPAQGRAGGGRGGRQIDSTRMGRMQQRDTAQMAAMRERLAEMATPAGTILQLRERLGLTDDQVNRLETLKASYVEPAQTQLPELREELANASKGEANLTAVRAAMNKINQVTTDAMVTRLAARNKARAVLNADQQVQFDAIEARRPNLLQGGMGMGGAGMRGGGRGAGAELPAAGARRGGRGGPPGTPPPAMQPPSR